MEIDVELMDGLDTLEDHEDAELFYLELVENGLMEMTFFGGGVESFEDWCEFIESDYTHVYFVWLDNKPVGFVWLDRYEGKCARFHCCCYQTGGNATSLIGIKVIEYLFSLLDKDGNRYYTVLIGATPYRAVDRFGSHLGFKPVGVVPKMFYMKRKDKYVDGYLSFINEENLKC